MNTHLLCVMAVVLLGNVSVSTLHAEVSLPAIFGDHMVLQAGKKLLIWGMADPGEMVKVQLGDEATSATADVSGKWQISFPAHPEPSSKPTTLTVTGKNTLRFTDVLIGDVWICSGQSNMAFACFSDYKAKETIAAANEPEIRLFRVPYQVSLDPKSDIAPAPTNAAQEARWQICSPDVLASRGLYFTAAGYYFGHDLYQTLHRPIGLVETCESSTPAQAWTSCSGLEKEQALKHYLVARQKIADNFAHAAAEYPAKVAAFEAANAAWQAQYGVAWQQQMAAWYQASKAAIAAGQPPPARPVLPVPQPVRPRQPEGDGAVAANLYNGMIAPLIPFAIKGAIWYQGESNVSAGYEYRTLFRRMITDWREKWGQGDFPFLFVQLASFDAAKAQNWPKTENWPYLREAQALTLSLPETGMATAVDIGDASNIHPADKIDVGHRLALVARHLVYGEKIAWSGPVYESAAFDGGTTRISFTNLDDGLVIGQAPWVALSAKPLPADHLLGFTIAGADKNWVPANAKIDGSVVVVSSPQVAVPVAVRYGWANVTGGNLYNGAGLPAPPFRTDDWPDPAMGPGAIPVTTK
jgi:sialate O-acetylesterase